VGRRLKSLGICIALVAACALLAASAASADDWLPHPSNAQWTYLWSDSVYNPAGTVESVTVHSESDPSGCGWVLAWTSPSTGSGSSGSQSASPTDDGEICFQDTNAGLLNTSWASSQPLPGMPILCATVGNCSNSLSSALFNVIWGSRNPVLSEPLLQGTTWTSSGGGDNSVSSSSTYEGLQLVEVPAFPHGVMAAVVSSNIAQAGAIGDPYGSGLRTTWWVNGVGPVKVVFDHEGGSSAPVTVVTLQSTNLKPLAPRTDQDYFPLRVGLTGTYQWTNQKHLAQPEVEKISVAAVANRSARISVTSVSGPIKVNGQYGFSLRLDGLTNIWGSTSAASTASFPRLTHGRHFFTPLDLMTFGFNPVLPAYPVTGSAWRSGNANDYSVYGVNGWTKVIGVRTVRVPAGTFRALEVRSVLTQQGSRFGSGVRTCWFAAGRGLVQLVFQHRDGSVSVVQLMK
jgi:hypothetical protein